MPADLPKISIITVVRNAAATLPRAIDSLIAQGYPRLEYLVLDAASTDGTVDVIQRYGPAISHWRSHADDGPNAAYNEGIARASGEIIGLLNADDWFEPGVLNAVGEAFRDDPALDMVTAEARVLEEQKGQMVEIRRFAGRSQLVNPCASPMPNARFYRKELFARHGGFAVLNHEGKRFIASDLEFLLRLSQHPIRNRVLPLLGYSYLRHAGSITFGDDPKRMRQMYAERAALAGQYLRSPALKPYTRRLRRWHRRGSIRAFYWHLAEKDFKKAWQDAARGIRVSHFAWLMDALRLGITGGYKL